MSAAAPGAKKKGKKGKKGDDAEKTILFGRPGNNVKMGIVGMPNVGKSLLFNILSGLSVPSENFPFCTIDPSAAQVAVPDKRYDFLCNSFKPKSKVQAHLTITDIAGLVKGASEGKGLGNAFLSHIMAVDGIYHVVRAFDAKEVEHVEGNVDPTRDLEIIANELRSKDIEMLKKTIDGKRRVALSTKDKKVKDEFACLEKMLAHMEGGKDIRIGEWSNLEIEIINTQLCLSAKPVIFLANVGKADWKKGDSDWLPRIKEWVDEHAPGSVIIPFCASVERKVADQLKGMESKENESEEEKKNRKKLMKKSKMTKIIHTGYSALNLIHYFTCGADEVKCWTIRGGTNAKKAAGVIHTDFEKGFICADTMSFEDFKKFGSESEVKSNGRYRTEGKDYIVEDGDILLFKHNAGGAKKKR